MIGWFRKQRSFRRRPAGSPRPTAAGSLARGPERLEDRALLAQLTVADVETLLDRASAATPSTDAIIAIVDRAGAILGVRTESDFAGMSAADLAFAIDGAVAKARTGAFFSNGQAILTSRTVSHISQSTVTQREMQANPASGDPTTLGPGYVAPVSVGGEFPPGILRQPLVDLFAIEHTNRVSVFTKDPALGGTEVVNRDSYGEQSGAAPGTVSRGIATLPGGIAIYSAGTDDVVGGIGVFFPGKPGSAQFGTATFEQAFVASPSQTRTDRLNAPKALEAESIALKTLLPLAIPGTRTPLVTPTGADPLLAVTLTPQLILTRAGGLAVPLARPMTLGQAQALVDRVNAAARINLGGIALQSFGPQAGPLGVQTLFRLIGSYGSGVVNGADRDVLPGVPVQAGTPQADGWLVPATNSTIGGLTAAQVTQLVNQGIAQATRTRAQIRVQPTFAKMVLAVADKDGTLLGVFRMPDATVFSIDVAIAKSRNTAYYASADLQPQDQVVGIPKGTAFTNRTVRYLAVPKYPSGNASAAPGPFSILNTPGINPRTGLNTGAPLPAAAFNGTVLGYDSFNPGTNFRATTPAGNQNGVVFFPGSTAVYLSNSLKGGYGISGDGVDQDDVVTFYGSAGYSAPAAIQAVQYSVRGIRLPYIKFSRTATVGV
jgi:uncharacterized protein GlcG (DUF336 family)